MRMAELRVKRAAFYSAVVLVLATLLLCFASCGKTGVYTSTYFDTFDTVLTLHIPATSRQEAETHARQIHNMVLDLHKQFDIYHTYEGINNLKTINDSAGTHTPLTVSSDIIELLRLGKEMYAITDGKVNICMGSVLSLWRTYRQDGRELPPMDALESAALACDPDSLIIDTERSTVMITDPHMTLDVGAVAKGYVASRVQAYAKENGLESLLFDLGGHILALGTRTDREAWEIGIRDPVNGGVYTTLTVSDASVVTSGNDQRYYEVNGVKYHHLIDPVTLMPADYHASVTVVIPLDATIEADGLSTALFLMPRETGEKLLTEVSPTGEAIWIPTKNRDAQ